MRIKLLLASASWLLASSALALEPPEPQTVTLEDMTWTEVAARMTTGVTTIIIPTGGTEQNGPHLTLGKHNRIVARTARDIALELGNAMVAPVVAYVPEGSVSPPQGHMRFPGTISISPEHFAGVLEDSARSFKQHGFKLICFVGDSGGNQAAQADVAAMLTEEWAQEGVRVLHVNTYYEDGAAVAWLGREKMGGAKPQAHGGFMDTAELMAAQPQSVRVEGMDAKLPKDSAVSGAEGDPEGATAKIGEKLLAYKVAAAVAQIRAAQGSK